MTNQFKYGLYAFAAALLTGMMIVMTEILLRFYTVDSLVIILFGNFSGAALLLFGAWSGRVSFGEMWRPVEWVRLIIAASLLYVAGIVFALAAIGQLGAGKTALLGQLETPFVVVLAIIFLGEVLSLRRWIAGAMAVGGTLLINFDPTSLQLEASWGTLYAILAPLSFAVGIIIFKPLLDQKDARWVTGISLLIGGVLLLPFTPTTGFLELGFVALFLMLLIGVMRALAWLSYNFAVQYIGPAQSSLIFISFAFIAVLMQLGVSTVMPALGLQPPENITLALLGGGIVAFGIVLLQTEKEAEPV